MPRFSRPQVSAQRAAASAIILALVACGVSQQREVEIGQDYSREVDLRLPLVRDPEVARYLAVLGDSIASIADRRDLNWSFKLVNSREVNAFAIPGGFVYINRGLIERADNLSEVAGVLAHEIAHVTQRHSIQQMQKATGANLGLIAGCILAPAICQNPAANAMQVAAGGLFASFSRSDESEADDAGVDYLIRAGIDPNGIPEMFRKLIEDRGRRRQSVDAFFATHPLEEARVARSEELIATYDPDLLKGLTVDSPRFQEFRRRLISLPPPRAPLQSPAASYPRR